jgi:hypothetical protein
VPAIGTPPRRGAPNALAAGSSNARAGSRIGAGLEAVAPWMGERARARREQGESGEGIRPRADRCITRRITAGLPQAVPARL